METYKVGQLVFFLKFNKVHSAEIQCKKIVENLHEDWASTPEQKEIWTAFGPEGVYYSTIDGILTHDKIFLTEEELLKSLKEK